MSDHTFEVPWCGKIVKWSRIEKFSVRGNTVEKEITKIFDSKIIIKIHKIGKCNVKLI